MMTPTSKHQKVMRDLRSRFWHALPARAYRIRRLVTKTMTNRLEPGERDELELLAKRLAGAGEQHGFEEVTVIAARLVALLEDQRIGGLEASALVHACDDLDAFIDDMTIEALATRLRAVLG